MSNFIDRRLRWKSLGMAVQMTSSPLHFRSSQKHGPRRCKCQPGVCQRLPRIGKICYRLFSYRPASAFLQNDTIFVNRRIMPKFIWTLWCISDKRIRPVLVLWILRWSYNCQAVDQQEEKCAVSIRVLSIRAVVFVCCHNWLGLCVTETISHALLFVSCSIGAFITFRDCRCADMVLEDQVNIVPTFIFSQI